MNVLITQPEVNSIKGITIIGHSEGTIIAPSANDDTNAPTSMSLFDQGLVQVLQASVTGLEPKHTYVLALSLNPNAVCTGVKVDIV